MSGLKEFYAGKKVLVTGHTGFKGAWLSEWLLGMGASVTGVSLAPNTDPSLFWQLDLAPRMDHHILDINDQDALVDLIASVQPDLLFHLAAQPLVRYSYDYPVDTFATNVMGTVHVMEGLRRIEGACQAVMITTDKCYENREQREPYCEDDAMGGHDPYSASKGAAELVIASYRRSFFAPEAFGSAHSINIASARAGNVIGGGDWALDRIVPDCMRMLGAGKPIAVRNAVATRPWQHVLEPLGGYLTLGQHMATVKFPSARQAICSGFNFGPNPEANRSVRDLVEKVISCWPGEWIDGTEPGAPHEAGLLNLAIHKAEAILGWRPVWNFDQAIEYTVDWYRTTHQDSSLAQAKTLEQIEAYSKEMEL
jgi:CDP-glucose 4,6-dehydratase